MGEEDTGWIVHVWLWCVKVGVGAEQLWDQRQHQRWVTRTQELKTPEQREYEEAEADCDVITKNAVKIIQLFFLQ